MATIACNQKLKFAVPIPLSFYFTCKKNLFPWMETSIEYSFENPPKRGVMGDYVRYSFPNCC